MATYEDFQKVLTAACAQALALQKQLDLEGGSYKKLHELDDAIDALETEIAKRFPKEDAAYWYVSKTMRNQRARLTQMISQH